MKDFALLFRVPKQDSSNASPKEIEALTNKWTNWIKDIASQGKLLSSGPRLSQEGKVLKPGGVITDGPFVESREILGSLLVVKADSIEEATTLAHGCPALDMGGSVEIRPLYEQAM